MPSSTTLPPLHLPFDTGATLSDQARRTIARNLAADQARRDHAARRAGRDPLAEAISAHLAACARLGKRPLIEAW